MDRRKYLKPFAASVVTLLAGAQADASLPTNLADAISNPDTARVSTDGVVLVTSVAGVQMAQHESHSSHSSHASHSSHSSSSH